MAMINVPPTSLGLAHLKLSPSTLKLQSIHFYGTVLRLYIIHVKDRKYTFNSWFMSQEEEKQKRAQSAKKSLKRDAPIQLLMLFNINKSLRTFHQRNDGKLETAAEFSVRQFYS